MRKAMVFAVAMTIGAGVAMADGAAMTAPAAKPAKKEASKKPHTSRVAGVVVTIDAAGGKLSVKTKKETKDFTVAADVKVMKGKTKAALADVMVNDEVSVMIETAGDVVTVKSITIKAPKAPAKK